ncbi:MAG: hypothetical protein CL847_04690 [Crocinitomicaceae bacterium]|nr:hypothetical protein [Crocinitomicaceae bacterium]
MKPLASDKIAIVGGIIYSIILSISIYFEFIWLALLPIAFVMLWWVFKRMDLFVGTLLIAVPLSLNIQEFSYSLPGLYLPTEPMLFSLLSLFILRFFKGYPVDKRIFNHHITFVIGGMMLWMAITSVTSYDILVSIKFLISRSWFIVGFFFVLGHVMLHKPKFREHMIMMLLFPLVIVIIYTLIRHASHDFSKNAGHWMMKPFFKDHTSYGAVLAMMFPPSVALLLKKDRPGITRVLLGISTFILAVGIVFSFTRAAWVSLVGVGAIYACMKMGIKFKQLALIGVLVIGLFWINKESILIELQRNKQDSSDNLTEHVESISNVSSDDSNLERLNRWNCAISLFKERPLMGWGPGTYQFVYAPFQEARYQTIISTNNADGGNAHSEYLGPLAEQGIFGPVFVLLIFWYVCVLGFRLWNEINDIETRNLALGIYLGLMTYFIHGVLNNYLDTDKASAPFWGFIAFLVVLDIELREKTKKAITS